MKTSYTITAQFERKECRMTWQNVTPSKTDFSEWIAEKSAEHGKLLSAEMTTETTVDLLIP